MASTINSEQIDRFECIFFSCGKREFMGDALNIVYFPTQEKLDAFLAYDRPEDIEILTQSMSKTEYEASELKRAQYTSPITRMLETNDRVLAVIGPDKLWLVMLL